MPNGPRFLKIIPQRDKEEKFNEIVLLKKDIKTITEIESFNINPSNFFSTFVKIKGSELTDNKLNTLFIFPILIIDIQNFYLDNNGDLIDQSSIKNTNKSNYAGININDEFTDNAYKFIYKQFFSPLPEIENIEEFKNIQPTLLSYEEEKYVKMNKKLDESIKMMRLDENHLIVFFNGIQGLRSENSAYVKNGLIFLKKYWDNIMNKTKRIGLKKITYKEIFELNQDINLKKSIQDEIINKYGISLNSVNFLHISTDLSRVCSGFIIGRDLIKNTGVENCIKIKLDFDKNKFNTKLKTSDLKESNIKNLVKAMPYIDFYNTLNNNNNKLDPKINNSKIVKLYNNIYFNDYNYSINSNQGLNIFKRYFEFNLSEKDLDKEDKLIIKDFLRYKYSLYNKKYIAYNQINYILNLKENYENEYNNNLIQNSDENYLFELKDDNYYILDTNGFYKIKYDNSNLYIDIDTYENYTKENNYKNIIFNSFDFNYNNILNNLSNDVKFVNLMLKTKNFLEIDINNIISNIKYKSSEIVNYLQKYKTYLQIVSENLRSDNFLQINLTEDNFNKMITKIKNNIINNNLNILNDISKNIINNIGIINENLSLYSIYNKVYNFKDYNENYFQIFYELFTNKDIEYNKYKYDINSFIDNLNINNKYHMIFLTYLVVNIILRIGNIQIIFIDSIDNKYYDIKNYIKKILEIDEKILKKHFNYFINLEFKDLENLINNIFDFSIETIFTNNYLKQYDNNLKKNNNFKYDDPQNIYSNLNPNYMIISLIMSETYYNLFNDNNLDKYIDNNLPKLLDVDSGLHILNKFINNKSGIYPKGYQLPLVNKSNNSISLNIQCLKSEKTKKKYYHHCY